MGSGFQKRKSTILRIIVGEYISSAVPVASEFITRNYDLGVSPATIRNDMSRLEEEGYLTRPHTSAGTVPSGKAYRRFVEELPENIELTPEEQQRVRRSFLEVEEEIDKWLKVAAFIVSRMAGNVSLVTFPKAHKSRFKHLELVAIHEFLAMLILVLGETSVKQHLLSFTDPVSQEDLNTLANKLNGLMTGLTYAELAALEMQAGAREQRLIATIAEIMEAEDEVEYSQPYFEGLRRTLEQPEFGQKEKLLNIMELVEMKDWLTPFMRRQLNQRGVQVVIGNESNVELLEDLSLVLNNYGVPRRVAGTIGVIGPTRMDYTRAICAVNCVSSVLNDLLSKVYCE